MNDMKLRYVIIYVPDVVQTVEFYERAFGLTRSFVHDSGQYAELATGTTALAFASETDTTTCHAFEPNRLQNKAAGAEVALVTDRVEEAFATAVAAGAHPEVEPTAKPWGQTISYVRDLNGFLVELCSPVAR